MEATGGLYVEAEEESTAWEEPGAVAVGSAVLPFTVPRAGLYSFWARTLSRFDDDLKGTWIDFVQHAKWTGNADGFVRLWIKVGEGDYKQVVDYAGVTWWNDEGDGPYFKMGLYTGDPGWQGRSPAVVYTYEYRLGSADAGFEVVAPGRE